jgi:putative colanic acid biosynthesis acetyltransferase WcaF
MSSATTSRQRVVHHLHGDGASHAYERPAFALSNRLARLAWSVVWVLLYRTSPRPMHAWRVMLLQLFGAKMGEECYFYPHGKVWAPWNLQCEDHCTLADDAEIYNPSLLYMESHVIVSQQAYICGATHDYDDPDFPMISYPMRLGAYSWICARACVAPGVRVGEGAVLGLAAVATGDLEPWGVYTGSPATKVKTRQRQAVTE